MEVYLKLFEAHKNELVLVDFQVMKLKAFLDSKDSTDSEFYYKMYNPIEKDIEYRVCVYGFIPLKNRIGVGYDYLKKVWNLSNPDNQVV